MDRHPAGAGFAGGQCHGIVEAAPRAEGLAGVAVESVAEGAGTMAQGLEGSGGMMGGGGGGTGRGSHIVNIMDVRSWENGRRSRSSVLSVLACVDACFVRDTNTTILIFVLLACFLSGLGFVESTTTLQSSGHTAFFV